MKITDLGLNRPMSRSRPKHVVHSLINREHGVRCPWWSSISTLRLSVFGPRRCWNLILKKKENSSIELWNDMMWVTKPLFPYDGERSIMHRISSNGKLMPMYRINLHPRPKEILMYDIPHPVYQSSVSQHEYRPVMCILRKGNVLTRHDLHTGKLYNNVHLGDVQRSTITPSFMQDLLVVKSPKLRYAYNTEYFFNFDVFQMHPFQRIASFIIDGKVFPGEKLKKRYGKLRAAEIHDGMLLVMTEKNFSLIYNAQEIIESKSVSSFDSGLDSGVPEESQGQMVTETPPLLFVTYAHMDIVGMGACPWTYIHAVSDNILEVRDLKTDQLLDGGRVAWTDCGDQDISPDYLMFFPDDSNRLINVKTSELRVLDIQEIQGRRQLVEVFHYPRHKRITSGEAVLYTRTGRLLKSRFKIDDSLNRTLAFDVELDLMILVILEAKRDIVNNCTNIVKAAFYDSITYEYLSALKINEKVDGDIELNRLSVHMDRDILSIVSHKGNTRTVLLYRLQEIRRGKINHPKNRSEIVIGSDDDVVTDVESSTEDESGSRRESGNRRRRNTRKSQRQRALQHRSTRSRRASQNSDGSDTNSASSDEWHP